MCTLTLSPTSGHPNSLQAALTPAEIVRLTLTPRCRPNRWINTDVPEEQGSHSKSAAAGARGVSFSEVLVRGAVRVQGQHAGVHALACRVTNAQCMEMMVFRACGTVSSSPYSGAAVVSAPWRQHATYAWSLSPRCSAIHTLSQSHASSTLLTLSQGFPHRGLHVCSSHGGRIDGSPNAATDLYTLLIILSLACVVLGAREA
jgi:hypothetical protein